MHAEEMTPHDEDKGNFDDTEPAHGHEHDHADGAHHAHEHAHGNAEHRHDHDDATSGEGLAGGPVDHPGTPSGDYDDKDQ